MKIMRPLLLIIPVEVAATLALLRLLPLFLGPPDSDDSIRNQLARFPLPFLCMFPCHVFRRFYGDSVLGNLQILLMSGDC